MPSGRQLSTGIMGDLGGEEEEGEREEERESMIE